MRSAEYQRGYDAGYKQALLDALQSQRSGADMFVRPGREKRFQEQTAPRYPGIPKVRRELGVPVGPKRR